MNKGFTLIELLIILAIIGILSGVVVTAIGGESDKSETNQTQSRW